MQRITLQIINEVGLHARPASEFVKLSGQFKASIQVRNLTRNSSAVDAKSILSVLMLGVEKNHEIELVCDGEDELQALEALSELIESDFAGKF
jgi:phosphotransferase system HPr (HPr) family protein